MDINYLVKVLGGRQTGENQYQARCPCHDDAKASLSISTGKDGKLLVYCHAGCSGETILKYIRDMNIVTFDTNKKTTKAKQTLGKETAIYSYVDRFGNELYQKVRYEPKDFRCRVQVAGQWKYSLSGVAKVLYNLKSIVDSAVNDTLVCICEGEKDCETLSKLGLGIVTTTNFDGASKWREEYNDDLKNRRVIIFEDNDESGKLHTRELVKHLKNWVSSLSVVRFAELEDKADVSDFCAINWSNAKERVNEKIQNAEVISLTPDTGATTYQTPRGKDVADYQDYIDLIYSLKKIKDIKRCALTDELMILSSDVREWDYAANWLGYFKAHAGAYGDFFKLQMFDYHLERHRIDDKARELRVSIPAWNGVDLLRSQINVFRFANYSKEEAYEIIRQWGAGIFLRLKDPYSQNYCLILQGVQRCGKDSLIESWISGLGDYKKDLDISSNLEEAKKSLHSALVWNISEFDKTARVDQASLKDIITRPETDVRLAYDRRQAKRMVRASFVASCNQKNVFTDETGNRRFVMLECEDLGLEIEEYGSGKLMGTGEVINEYPGLWCRSRKEEERVQILAFFKHCAESGTWKASDKTMQKVRGDMAERTPQTLEEMVSSAWEFLSQGKVEFTETDEDGCKLFSSEEAKEEFQELAKRFQLKEQRVRQLLADNYRVEIGKNKTRYYRVRPKGQNQSINTNERAWYNDSFI